MSAELLQFDKQFTSRLSAAVVIRFMCPGRVIEMTSSQYAWCQPLELTVNVAVNNQYSLNICVKFQIQDIIEGNNILSDWDF